MHCRAVDQSDLFSNLHNTLVPLVTSEEAVGSSDLKTVAGQG